MHVFDELFFVTRPFPFLESRSKVVLPTVAALLPVPSIVQLCRNFRPRQKVVHSTLTKDFEEIAVVLCIKKNGRVSSCVSEHMIGGIVLLEAFPRTCVVQGLRVFRLGGSVSVATDLPLVVPSGTTIGD
jgi:hypothetical protein